MPKQDERDNRDATEDTPDDAEKGAGAAVDPDAGGAEPEEASGEDELTRYKQLHAKHLSERTSLDEREKALKERERQLAEREERGETPAPTADSSQRELDKVRRQLDEDLRSFEEDAASNDPVRARYGRQMLRQHRHAENQWREAQLGKDLKAAPADLRDDVEKLLRSGEAGNLKAAIRLAKSDRRDAEEAAREKEREDRNDDKRERREAAPSLGGGGNGGPSRERNRPLTKAQVIERKRQLRESGSMEERQKFQSDLEAGRITVRG